MTSIDQSKVNQIFESISSHLTGDVKLSVIGSTVGIMHGQAGRMTEDIDVWADGSDFDHQDLRSACEKAGVLFNPVTLDTPDRFYMQIVQEGITQLGDYDKSKEKTLLKIGKLLIVSPPIENIVASKLVRASQDDITDIVFLTAAFNIPMGAIESVIDTMPALQAEQARENIVLLTMQMSFIIDSGEAIYERG